MSLARPSRGRGVTGPRDSPPAAGDSSRRHAVVLVLCAWLAACATPKPGPAVGVDAFTERVAGVIRSRERELPVHVRGPLRIDVGEFRAILDRVYRFCLGTDDATCRGEIDHYVGALLGHVRGAPLAPTAADVRLAVRTEAYVGAATEFAGGRDVLQPRPFVDGLVILPVVDQPQTIRMLVEADNRSLALDPDAVFRLGLQNLAAEWSPLLQVAAPAPPGRLGHFTGGAYESSRVIDHAQWQPLVEAQHGTLFVSLPTTDTILYASEASIDAIDALQVLSRQILQHSPNPLSDAVLKWTPEGWQKVR